VCVVFPLHQQGVAARGAQRQQQPQDQQGLVLVPVLVLTLVQVQVIFDLGVLEGGS